MHPALLLIRYAHITAHWQVRSKEDELIREMDKELAGERGRIRG